MLLKNRLSAIILYTISSIGEIILPHQNNPLEKIGINVTQMCWYNIDTTNTLQRGWSHIILMDKVRWIETPLSSFGNKCVLNRHMECKEDKCQCLCHRTDGMLS
jgi:hypothetical protein